MGARERKGKERKGRERKGKEGKGERKGKEGKGWERERKGKDGKGRKRKGKEGKGRERKGRERKGKEKGKEGVGKEAAGHQRVWLRGRLRTAWVQGWLEMVGEKKPLVMSELGCADGCGRRGCKGVVGNGWGEEAAGDQRRAWLCGRLRTANGCGELRGQLRTA